MEINLFLIVFMLLIAVLAIYFPLSGYLMYKRLLKQGAHSEGEKLKLYRQTILWLWILLLVVLLLIPLTGMEPHDIGIKWITVDTVLLPAWFIYPGVVLYVVYLLYNIYLIIALRRSKETRAKLSKGITDTLKWFLPITQREKTLWGYVSITAGIAEEIIYRGYLFYALAVIFPDLSLLYILLITSVIFGLGHSYQGSNAIKPMLLGLVFGIFYIVFDSVFPIIILHIAQDLVVRELYNEKDHVVDNGAV
ncbi:CPBP family intramembrane glutamic endopeptidase [Flavobacteriaceae bacterium 3-367]